LLGKSEEPGTCRNELILYETAGSAFERKATAAVNLPAAQNISPRATENEGERSAKPAPDPLIESVKEIEHVASEANREQSRKQEQALPLEPADPPVLRTKIPPILLEGDETVPSQLVGSDPKFALGAPPVAHGSAPEAAVLPEAYGTERLWLAARDPHCLYARWDLTSEQERNYSALATGNHLVLRLHLETVHDSGFAEVRLLPDTRHCFIPVAAAGRRYLLELGYYQKGQSWRSIAVSDAVSTPQEGIARDKTVRFATVATRSIVTQQTTPSAAPFGSPKVCEKGQTQQPVEPSKLQSLPETFISPGAVRMPQPGPQAEPTSHASAQPAFPAQNDPEGLLEAESAPASVWGSAQEEALAEIIEWSAAGLEAPSSAAMTQFEQPQVPLGPPVGISSLPPQEQISSPVGGEIPKREGFWLSVNAELVIYGATEPTALVTVGGRPIQLRPDGTFSCRFALPDGRYELPIEAASARGELRRADLEFYRGTTYQGEVQAHPQSPDLKKPDAGNVP
jgi:hypothetical protein